jgi:hypothetical protein
MTDLAERAKGWFSEDGFLAAFAKVSRPLAVTMTVAILPMGGFVIGSVSGFNAAAGAAMAKNSVAFFAGLPEALYWMVGGIATGYFGAKAYETKSAPPPIGRPSPEAPIEEAKPTVIVAPGPGQGIDEDADPADVDIAGRDYSRSTMATGGSPRLERPFIVGERPNETVLPTPTFDPRLDQDPATKPAKAGETPEVDLS